MNTETRQSLTYRVITDDSELPRGTRFTVFPGAPVQDDQLIIFLWHGVEQIGRWYPNVGGIDHIIQPERVIYIEDPSSRAVELIGPIVPLPEPAVCEAGRIKPAPVSCN